MNDGCLAVLADELHVGCAGAKRSASTPPLSRISSAPEALGRGDTGGSGVCAERGIAYRGRRKARPCSGKVFYIDLASEAMSKPGSLKPMPMARSTPSWSGFCSFRLSSIRRCHLAPAMAPPARAWIIVPFTATCPPDPGRHASGGSASPPAGVQVVELILQQGDQQPGAACVPGSPREGVLARNQRKSTDAALRRRDGLVEFGCCRKLA
jgi:hypothetical protein